MPASAFTSPYALRSPSVSMATSMRARLTNRLDARRASPAACGHTSDMSAAGNEDRRAVRERARRRRRRRERLAVAVAAAVVAMLVVGAVAARNFLSSELSVSGPAPGAVIGRAGLERLAFSVDGSAATLRAQRWTLDGREVRARMEDGRIVFRPRRLREGAHRLEIEQSLGLGRTATASIAFHVDLTPPRVRLDAPAVTTAGAPLSVAGSTEAGATLRVGARGVPVRDGRFRVRFAGVPARPVTLVATDAAGNASRWRMPVTVVPRRPAAPVRAVHVTAYGWADDGLRASVLSLVREGRINAVELDLKDESGVVGWAAPVPLARRIGAAQQIFDLPAAVRRLHALGVRVIGRLVCFRDPVHAAAAWSAGRRDQVVQTPDGAAYAGYGGFTNFAHPAVRAYNLDLAVAAARAGVDEILYDYVRRPDGPISSMVFPGLRGTPEASIAAFLRESRAALAGAGALLGASVFGIAATRPGDVAQDIPAMARHVDYIAPMVYPSHWNQGEYDVADPNGEPGAIVRASIRDFVAQVRGTGARIVPWLQDFSLGRTYGPAEVRAQIDAARAAGADEFILWDAAVTYTAEALTTDAPEGTLRLAEPEAPSDAPGLRRIG
jgi:hypothetical protein